MQAAVGARMLLETYGVKDRIKCRLVGWVEDEFVVLQAPLTPGIRSRVTANSQMAVRYLHEGDLIGFRAEYIDFLIRPIPLLLISYPERFEVHSLRDSKRLSCSCMASLTVKGGLYNGLLVDLSRGGCRFRFEPGQTIPQLKKGDPAEGYFSTLGSAETYNFSGVVASTERVRQHREVGLMFDASKTTLPEDLTAYLEEVGEMLGSLKD